MRYAVLKLNYDRDMDEPDHIFGIQTEIIRVCHTISGAYEVVDKWYDKTIEEMSNHFLEGDFAGQLKTEDYILKKFDDGETNVWSAIIESGFLTKRVTKIYIQGLDEITQI